MCPGFLGLAHQEPLVGGEHIDRYTNVLPEPVCETRMCNGIIVLEGNLQTICLCKIAHEKMRGTCHPVRDHKRRCFR